MASYDVSITPATPALSIRRKKTAPLPMQLRKNVSPDKAVFLLGPLTSDPYEIATTWNECRAAMGYTLIGHHSSKWDEVFISHMLQRYQVISNTIRGQAPYSQPPCPYNLQGSPFLEANLLEMIRTLPAHKAPGDSGITYAIIKKGDPTLCKVLHHLFTRIWNLAAPNTHDGALAVSPTQWSLNLLKPIHKPGRDKTDPHNYRAFGLGDALGMVYQMGLRDVMTTHTLAHDLLTSAQGVCQAHWQPFDTVFTLTEFITSRKQMHSAPTFVFFGDIALAFPAVNRDILLVRLAETGVSPKLWQHVLAPHRTLKYRVLHDNAANNPYIEIKKGLTEGGRLSPLLWGLYVADLVNTIRRDFPGLALPPPHAMTILASHQR